MSAKRSGSRRKTEKWINGRLVKASLGFVGLYLLLNAIIIYLANAGDLAWLITLTTQASASSMHLVGVTTTVSNNLIIVGGKTLEVDLECTAIFFAALFTSFLAVYPTTLKRKAVGIAIGLPGLFVINIIRLVILGAIEVGAPAYADAFHDYIWQVGFIVILAGVWLLYSGRETAR